MVRLNPEEKNNRKFTHEASPRMFRETLFTLQVNAFVLWLRTCALCRAFTPPPLHRVRTQLAQRLLPLALSNVSRSHGIPEAKKPLRRTSTRNCWLADTSTFDVHSDLLTHKAFIICILSRQRDFHRQREVHQEFMCCHIEKRCRTATVVLFSVISILFRSNLSKRPAATRNELM